MSRPAGGEWGAGPEAPPGVVTRRQLVSMSLGSALVMAVVACGISLVRFHSLAPLVAAHAAWVSQVAAGILVGAGFAIGAGMLFLRAPAFADGRAKAREVFRSARLSSMELTLMAVGAGVGEELLFRAALQPLLGLWLSTVLFTAVHYWVPVKGLARAMYAVFLFAVSLALGQLLVLGGLLAAMTAHAVVDLILLFLLRERLAAAAGG